MCPALQERGGGRGWREGQEKGGEKGRRRVGWVVSEGGGRQWGEVGKSE